MKKLLAICLVVMMMFAFTVPALAEISPEGGEIPGGEGGTDRPGDIEYPDGNDDPNSPQTGSTWMLIVAGVAVASLAGAAVATKKLVTNA